MSRLTQAGILHMVADAAAMDRDQHAHAFMAFVVGLLGDFDRSLAAGGPDHDPDLARDEISYRAAGMWLTDAEQTDFVRDLMAVVQPRLANPPAKGRRRRLLYSVFLPGPETD
ncbi:MAG: hypothetical protein ACRDZ8_02740 [Acidimicrobiales bacterium]